jgi:WXG100 family type VII secretion target
MPITVTPDQLRQTAGNLRTGSGNIGAELGRLVSDVRGMLGGWDGQAAAAFDGYYHAANDGFRQVETALEGIAQMLLGTADQYEQHDADLASRFAV